MLIPLLQSKTSKLNRRESRTKFWKLEALPVAKLSIGNTILHVKGDYDVVQMAVSVGDHVEVSDMRMLPARSMILRAALPVEEPRYRWTDEFGVCMYDCVCVCVCSCASVRESVYV